MPSCFVSCFISEPRTRRCSCQVISCFLRKTSAAMKPTADPEAEQPRFEQFAAGPHSLVAGSADRNRISSRIVFSGFVGGIQSTYFRKNACTCVHAAKVVRIAR